MITVYDLPDLEPQDQDDKLGRRGSDGDMNRSDQANETPSINDDDDDCIMWDDADEDFLRKSAESSDAKVLGEAGSDDADSEEIEYVGPLKRRVSSNQDLFDSSSDSDDDKPLFSSFQLRNLPNYNKSLSPPKAMYTNNQGMKSPTEKQANTVRTAALRSPRSRVPYVCAVNGQAVYMPIVLLKKCGIFNNRESVLSGEDGAKSPKPPVDSGRWIDNRKRKLTNNEPSANECVSLPDLNDEYDVLNTSWHGSDVPLERSAAKKSRLKLGSPSTSHQGALSYNQASPSTPNQGIPCDKLASPSSQGIPPNQLASPSTPNQGIPPNQIASLSTSCQGTLSNKLASPSTSNRMPSTKLVLPSSTSAVDKGFSSDNKETSFPRADLSKANAPGHSSLKTVAMATSLALKYQKSLRKKELPQPLDVRATIKDQIRNAGSKGAAPKKKGHQFHPSDLNLTQCISKARADQSKRVSGKVVKPVKKAALDYNSLKPEVVVKDVEHAQPREDGPSELPKDALVELSQVPSGKVDWSQLTLDRTSGVMTFKQPEAKASLKAPHPEQNTPTKPSAHAADTSDSFSTPQRTKLKPIPPRRLEPANASQTVQKTAPNEIVSHQEAQPRGTTAHPADPAPPKPKEKGRISPMLEKANFIDEINRIIAPFVGAPDNQAKAESGSQPLAPPVASSTPVAAYTPLSKVLDLPTPSLSAKATIYDRFASPDLPAALSRSHQQPKLERISELPVAKVGSDLMRTEDDYLSCVLKWNSVWLDEYCKLRGQPPPVLDGKYSFTLMETYDSYDDYYNAMMPLLLLETWEAVFNEWLEKKEKKSFKQLQLTLTQVTPARKKFLEFHFQGAINKAHADILPMENDLLVLDAPPTETDPQPVRPLFGLLRLVRKGVFRNGQIVHEKFRAFLHDPKMMVFDLVVQVLRRQRTQTSCDRVFSVTPVASLTTQLRQYNGLLSLTRSMLARDLLRPSNRMVFSCNVDTQPDKIATRLKSEVNPSQARAISVISEAVLSPYPLPKICLLHGPPGTGKSRTIVHLIDNILDVSAHEL